MPSGSLRSSARSRASPGDDTAASTSRSQEQCHGPDPHARAEAARLLIAHPQVAARGHRSRGRLHRSADAGRGPARPEPSQEAVRDTARPGGGAGSGPARPTSPPRDRTRTRRGISYLLDAVADRICCLRRRRVIPPHRGMEGVTDHADYPPVEHGRLGPAAASTATGSSATPMPAVNQGSRGSSQRCRVRRSVEAHPEPRRVTSI